MIERYLRIYSEFIKSFGEQNILNQNIPAHTFFGLKPINGRSNRGENAYKISGSTVQTGKGRVFLTGLNL